MSSCLRMPVAPGTSSCLAILVSAVTLMSLSVARSMRSFFRGALRRRCLGGLRRRAAAAAAAVAAVRQSGDQFPQFVQSFARLRRDRQHGPFKRAIRVLSVRVIRSARVSLSIFVATTRCGVAAALPASRQPRRSLSRPGCRASTSSSDAAATVRAGPAARSRASKYVRVSSSNALGATRRRRARSRSRAGPRGRTAAPASARDPIEVRQPRLAGRRARARHLLPHQRVDQASTCRRSSARPAPARAGRRAGSPVALAALVTNSASMFSRLETA